MSWYCSRSTHCLVNRAGLLCAVQDKGREREREREIKTVKSDYLSDINPGSFLSYKEGGAIITVGNAISKTRIRNITAQPTCLKDPL